MPSYQWAELGEMPDARMDSRGLLNWEDRYFLIGGLDGRLEVLDSVSEFTIEVSYETRERMEELRRPDERP